MEIHPTQATRIVSIVKHHLRPHVSGGRARSRWTGEPPGIGPLSLSPPIARMLDTVLGLAFKDFDDRGATEFQLRFDIPEGATSFMFEILDNGRPVDREVPAVQEAAREVGAAVTWSTSDNWNVVSLTSSF